MLRNLLLFRLSLLSGECREKVFGCTRKQSTAVVTFSPSFSIRRRKQYKHKRIKKNEKNKRNRKSNRSTWFRHFFRLWKNVRFGCFFLFSFAFFSHFKFFVISIVQVLSVGTSWDSPARAAAKAQTVNSEMSFIMELELELVLETSEKLVLVMVAVLKSCWILQKKNVWHEKRWWGHRWPFSSKWWQLRYKDR